MSHARIPYPTASLEGCFQPQLARRLSFADRSTRINLEKDTGSADTDAGKSARAQKRKR